MSPGEISGQYVRYIGAGAVAAGGILSMLSALPLIVGSIAGSLARSLEQVAAGENGAATARPDRARHPDAARAARLRSAWSPRSPPRT